MVRSETVPFPWTWTEETMNLKLKSRDEGSNPGTVQWPYEAWSQRSRYFTLVVWKGRVEDFVGPTKWLDYLSLLKAYEIYYLLSMVNDSKMTHE